MAKRVWDPAVPANQLLARLPREEFERLFPVRRPVSYKLKDVLFDVGASLEYAYFPNTGVISQITIMEDGEPIELWTVGNEGMVGLPIALGIIQSASRALVQVPSSGLRLAATKLVDEMSRDTPMRKLILRYAALSLCQVSQAVACNGLHSVRRRCCRWLLMTHDRVEGDEFPMTHEFLAQMLGVRRASVTTVLTPLQKAGLIRSRRGKISVVDRERLEENSCECYRTVQQEYIRLLG